MASKIKINLDTSKENYILAKCKQNDDLTLEASIFENGLEKDLTNAAITIQALKADKTYIIQNTNITKENNKIIANLDRDFTRAAGKTEIEILLVESGKQNTTFSFCLEVIGSVIRGAVESSNTVTILEELGNKIVEAGQVRDETEQLIQSGGAATTGDIQQVNAQLEQSVNFLKNGEIKLPSDFKKIPFSINRIKKREYKHSVTPYNQFNWNNAIEIFISSYATSNALGTDYKTPISLGRFKANLDSSLYSGNNFILNLVDNIHHHSSINDFANKNINVLIRSLSSTGFTWIIPSQEVFSSENNNYNWVSFEGVYKVTKPTGKYIDDIVNFNNIDNYGVPKNQYIKVTTLEQCKNTIGSFYQDDTTVYCNKFTDDNISFNYLNFRNKTISFNGNCGTTMFENVGFTTNSYLFKPTNFANFYFFNCKFYRGLQDAFAINGAYNCYVFDCVSAYGSKDGFNYHTQNTNSLAVEVNSVAYGSGQYKISNGNTTTNSNNGSTAHDGMFVLRIGGKYWECEGPIVADEDCYSINIGCEAYNILNSTTGTRAGFYLYKVNYPDLPKYAIECLVSGKYFLKSLEGFRYLYVLNMESKYPVADNIISIESWEE